MPLPPEDLAYSRAIAQYARGVALAAKGRFAESRAALDTLGRIAESGVQAYASAGWTTPSTNLQIATHALAGELAARQDQLDSAIIHFRAAMAIEDEQLYTEPPDWYYPIRHSLGALLLRAGQPAEAEGLYREDLTRFPENGWSLFGLAQALRAQQKEEEAAEVDARFYIAWAGADVRLTASRF
jgi:tetratricopeptide (TPR) repeat protein